MDHKLIVLAIALPIVFYLYQKWTAYAAFKAAVRQHGCEAPARYPHKSWWGLDLHRLRTAAMKEGYYNKLYQKHFDTFGRTFQEISFNSVVINTSDPANFQQVAAVAFNDYVKSVSRTRPLSPFLGSGIITEDGPQWKHARDLVKPLFVRSELSDIDTFRGHVDRMFALIPRDGSTMNLQPLIQSLFLDSSTEFLFGESMGSLQPTQSPETEEFLKAWNESLLGAGKRAKSGRFSFLYKFDRSWQRSYCKVHAFIDEHVRKALKDTETGVKLVSPSNQSERYVLLYEMAKEIRDPVKLRFQVLNVFPPAYGTTAIAVSNCLFNLARHPATWQQLRTIALALGEQPLTFELLKSLHFFRYVLFESIRLQGPSGIIARTAIRPTILPCGGGSSGLSPVYIPTGTTVTLNTYGSHHDPITWGPDVEKFKPERWANRRFTWEFTPFLGGPRICPAQQQVLTQAVYLLVRLTREFERLDNKDDVWEYEELARMLTESRNGVLVALVPAKA